ncbi:MAG: hypothetical protein LBO69_06250 [Ignavibacteria bacterium]|jgi:hypothetical protein|nr:hypothetical protein [Ignavibacteria bacterium]
MKTIFYSILILLLAVNLYSQELSLIGEINVAKLNSADANKVNIKFANNKTLGSYLSFMPAKFIDSVLKQHSVTNTDNIIISIESPQAIKYYTYNDFSKNVVAITPYIITSAKTIYRIGDTVDYITKGGSKDVSVDMSGMDAQVNNLLSTTVKLQFSKISEADKKQLFGSTSIIFPIDMSTHRWLSNITAIKVWEVK